MTEHHHQNIKKHIRKLRLSIYMGYLWFLLINIKSFKIRHIGLPSFVVIFARTKFRDFVESYFARLYFRDSDGQKQKMAFREIF